MIGIEGAIRVIVNARQEGKMDVVYGHTYEYLL
jgi:hypothetical protein